MYIFIDPEGGRHSSISLVSGLKRHGEQKNIFLRVSCLRGKFFYLLDNIEMWRLFNKEAECGPTQECGQSSRGRHRCCCQGQRNGQSVE